ncbi:MAG: SMC-Scp complex subunit ScpB [Planctomycetota bacterium]
MEKASGPLRNDDAPLSLKRLTAAFAQMLGAPTADADKRPPTDAPSAADPCEIGTKSIVEAVLFVGSPDGRALAADHLAAEMRNVSQEEVDVAIEELNAQYERDASPYTISSSAQGYRLALRPEMRRMGDKFQGRIRESRLTPAAMEVLSIVAYKQPVPGARIDQMRGARSGSLVASLVRRGLVRLDRPNDTDGAPVYRTTDRFLRLFGLTRPEQLPRVSEIED